MFTNAGMNQFKDFFTGKSISEFLRVANTQKCLRVSGKHNDLEEVGVDTYHHTMFEMLGNWSFGDYFKEDAIQFAWELLTKVYKLPKDRLYVTVFEGDKSDGLKKDEQAYDYWKRYVAEDRILYFGKKDNFWEMGETGPCGPCSEIHVDLRSEEERKAIDGAELVNKDDPNVIELWNLVFIQFERKANKSLASLPAKHVDTGMGLERLVRVLQAKDSNYKIDLFATLIKSLEKSAGQKYGQDLEKDVAFRVVADHLRAVSFSIAEGQLPSNTGPGYVIRRILRRAIRYGYSFLGMNEPWIYKSVGVLSDLMSSPFKELGAQKGLIAQIIHEEEENFLKTLGKGLKRIQDLVSAGKGISGVQAFELYDTYGFPLDLSKLIAAEHNLEINESEFNEELGRQKDRSRASAKQDLGDWVVVSEGPASKFIGYDQLESSSLIRMYREVSEKGKNYFQIMFDQSPFYPEGGGQVGDKGLMIQGDKEVAIWNTQKENDQIFHFVNELPVQPENEVTLKVNTEKRGEAAKNHSATHLLHEALRKVLGDHVEQKGSLVHPDYLRFDFSHFRKMTKEELAEVGNMVNKKISIGIPLNEQRNVPISDAKNMGAMSLFGEKYGDNVRVIKFGDSIELCGGTHVSNTAEIGRMVITGESAVSAGVRRIEAISGNVAAAHIDEQLELINKLKEQFAPQSVTEAISNLQSRVKNLEKDLERADAQLTEALVGSLKEEFEDKGDIRFLAKEMNVSGGVIKNIGFRLQKEFDNMILVTASVQNNRPQISVFVSRGISDKYDAREIVNTLAAHIQGRGGGQPFFATAGGKDVKGIKAAISGAEEALPG